MSGAGIDGWTNSFLFWEHKQQHIAVAASLAVVQTDEAAMELGINVAFAQRTSLLSPAVLARQWEIGLDAKRTLDLTTWLGVRTIVHPLERRFRTKLSHLQFPSYNAKVYTDPIFASAPSICGYACDKFSSLPQLTCTFTR